MIVGRTVDTEGIITMAKYFHNGGRSSCPTSEWLASIPSLSANISDEQSEKILINIGVNKGYNLAMWGNVW